MNFSGNYATIAEAGLDWLTITTTEGDRTDDLVILSKTLLDTEEARGGVKSVWAMQGYKGFKCGAVKSGVRKGTEGILVISGDKCHEYSPTLAQGNPHLTRLDLQCTIRLQQPEPLNAYRLYQKLLRLKEEGQIRQSLRYISSESGDTLYIGRRGKSVMLRFYDKSREYSEAQAGQIWRYEVEYGRNTASKAWSRVTMREFDPVWIANIVHTEFEKRKVKPEYLPSNRITAIEIGRKTTDAEGRLNWLVRCVSPVVTQLIASGYDDEVIDALSLRAYIQGITHNASK